MLDCSCIPVAWIIAPIRLWLHGYSCIFVTWLFSVTDIDIYCY